MPKLWDEKEKKVFLSRFKDSLMKKDSDGRYSSTDEYWRTKTYTKDHDKMVIDRNREFADPYQVAVHYSGGNWNDYNAPFTIQVGECNIDCIDCFVSDDLKKCKDGDYFSAEEIVKIWFEKFETGTFRISGGEPFLAWKFIVGCAKQIAERINHGIKKNGRYLWVDTNLLGSGYKEVVKALDDLKIPYSICGCFKGFDSEDFNYNTRKKHVNYKEMWQKQFDNSKLILKSMEMDGLGELFLYARETIEPIPTEKSREIVKSFMIKLKKEIHELAPLRVTVLSIKKYSANEHRFPDSRLETGITKQFWMEELEKQYGLDLVWLPQYQINIKQ